MNKFNYILSMIMLVVLLVFTGIYGFKILSILLMPKSVSVMQNLELYKWVAAGIVGFAVIHRVFSKNMKWMETFSHEMTHIVVALLTFRKIHSFHAEAGQGAVYTSGSNRYPHAPMALAPYCLPIFTYLLLSIRCLLICDWVWVYDIFIGTTICFHFFCFRDQTGSYQSDINQYPLSFSYLYIVTALVINFLVILVAFFPQYNVYTSFWRYLTSLLESVIDIYSYFMTFV